MEESNGVVDRAMKDRLWALAHDLNNALTVIAGHCELILAHAEVDAECSNRLHQILVIAHVTAKRINGHECRMSSPVPQNTADLNVLQSPTQSSAKPSRSTNPKTTESAKAG